jgi:hypothetical protein
MMKYYQKWAEFGNFLGKTSKNVKKSQNSKITLNRFSRFSQISRICREIRESNCFEFLEKFSRRTQSKLACPITGPLSSAAMADICAPYLQTGSTNNPPTPLPF